MSLDVTFGNGESKSAAGGAMGQGTIHPIESLEHLILVFLGDAHPLITDTGYDFTVFDLTSYNNLTTLW